VGVVIQFSCYQVVIHRRWSAYQLFIRQEVSNPENLNISWVRFFMGVFLIINLFFLFSLFVVIHFDGRQWIWQLTALVFSLSVFALGYKGILQKEIFYPEVREDKREPGHAVVATPAPQKHDQVAIEKLLQHMREKKPFLDPELTLSSLARQLELGRSQLSQLINDGMGSNFYDFVNRYRVEEVKHLLADPGSKHLSLLGIALDAGFKSKSTFNLVFKRFTGLTPTEYKNNLAE
jgi:AraC-like DNA-binding protein